MLLLHLALVIYINLNSTEFIFLLEPLMVSCPKNIKASVSPSVPIQVIIRAVNLCTRHVVPGWARGLVCRNVESEDDSSHDKI